MKNRNDFYKIKLYSYFILFLLINPSCKNRIIEDKRIPTVIKLNLSKIDTDFDFSTIVNDTFSIIPLETNEQCLVSQIDKIEILGNKILIRDDLAKSVFIFDLDGTFISKICKIGHGPGEYVGITDMTATDSTIVIIDRFSRKQLVYSYDGDLISEDNTVLKNIWANSIFFLGNNLNYLNNWSETKEGNFRLFSTNTENKKFVKLLPFDNEPKALEIGIKQYSVNKNEALVVFSGSDTIYGITAQKAFPKYYIDFAGSKVIYKTGKVENVFNENDGTKVLGISSVNETDKYLFFTVSGTKGDYICIYNKLTQMQVVCSNSIINKNFNRIDCDFRNLVDGKLLQYFSPHDLKFFYKEKYSKSAVNSLLFHERLRSVVNGLKDDDNPVLFVFNLK